MRQKRIKNLPSEFKNLVGNNGGISRWLLQNYFLIDGHSDWKTLGGYIVVRT